MLSLAQKKQKTIDQIIYSLAKMDSRDFAKLSPEKKLEQRLYLAKLRINQIKANPDIYQDGYLSLDKYLISGRKNL